MVDVLLVNPPSPDGSIIIRDFNRSGRTSKERIIWPQTNLAYMAAVVPAGLSVKIVDCIAEGYGWEDFVGVLERERPRYMASHVITSVSTNDFRAFAEAKGIAGTVTICMGPHVTELTEESFRDCPELDYILVGEPEITFRELVHALENKKDVSRIKGLAHREGKNVVINKKRPFIKNLDELPLPRQDLLPIDRYVFPFIASRFTFVISSRGCPYPCTYCRQPIMWQKKVRARSPENVMKELVMLKGMGVNSFIFHSDTFTIDRAWVIKLCKLMMESGLNMSWGCNSRVDTVDREMLQWMKRAGCWMIAYGIESGSDKILKNCRKEATLKQAIDAARWAHESGIKVYGYFILGLPGETRETMQETIDFSKKLPITFAIFHVASPYPGTEFYGQCIENGWLSAERWECINQGGTSAVSYPQLSSREIMSGIRRAYLSFYLRPGAIVNILGEVKNINDFTHLLKLMADHLRW